MFVFPAGISSANVDSFFDKHAGIFSQKISRKIKKCCFVMEVYSIEIFIWTLRMRFCQPRQNVFPRYEKTFCAKSENPGKIEYGSKKSIFPWNLLWKCKLHFWQTCRFFSHKTRRKYWYSFSLKKPFSFRILLWTHGMQCWQPHQKLLPRVQIFFLTTTKS